MAIEPSPRLQWTQLLELMEREPVADVLGVVSPKGVGGGQVPPETAWRLSVELTAWRIKGAPIQTLPLRVHRQVSEAELHRVVREISPCSVVHFRARLLRESPEGGPSGLLETFPEPDGNDPQLDAWAQKLQEPITFDEPTLGTFELDRRIDHYTAKARWCGKLIDLNLQAKGQGEHGPALETALTLWSQQETWSERIKEFAVNKLLRLKNDDWADEDEDGDEVVISRSEFKGRMKLQGVVALADRAFEFWYEDGGLFFGHAIRVWGDLDRGPVDAELFG